MYGLDIPLVARQHEFHGARRPTERMGALWLMGNFYGNITLKGVNEKSVIAVLNATMKAAFVSPAAGGTVSVFEAESDGDGEALWRLTAALSRDLECIAFAVMNHDDDLLLYQLFDSGELIDSYDSCPSFSGTASSSNPRGGEAAILCNAFNVPQCEQKLRAVLDKKYVTATNQHLDIVHLLKLNEEYSLLGYHELVQGGNGNMQLFEPTEEDHSVLPTVCLPSGFVKTGDDMALPAKSANPQRSNKLRRSQRQYDQGEIERAFHTGHLHFERMSDDAFERLAITPGVLTLKWARPGFTRSKWLSVGDKWESLDFVLAASDEYIQCLSLAVAGGAPMPKTEGARYLTAQQVAVVSDRLQQVSFDKLLSSYSEEEFEAARLQGWDKDNIECEFEQLRLCFKQVREFFAAAAEREELIVRYRS